MHSRREKKRETVDQVAQTLDCQQHAERSREEPRTEDQVCHREAIESKENQADGKAMFKQLDRYVRRSL